MTINMQIDVSKWSWKDIYIIMMLWLWSLNIKGLRLYKILHRSIVHEFMTRFFYKWVIFCHLHKHKKETFHYAKIYCSPLLIDGRFQLICERSVVLFSRFVSFAAWFALNKVCISTLSLDCFRSKYFRFLRRAKGESGLKNKRQSNVCRDKLERFYCTT